MIVLSIAIIYFSLKAPRTGLAIIKALSKNRERFESRVEDDPKYYETANIHSMPLDQHVVGYFPLGRSDCRFLIYFGSEGSFPQSVTFQRFNGRRARTLWRVDLVPLKSSLPSRGTLSKFLRSFNDAPPSHLTTAQANLFNAEMPYVSYDMVGESGGECHASVIRIDGTVGENQTFGSGTRCPILAEEAKAMGLGPIHWP